ncbi:MAG: DUF3109 family protein [Muribaculaceae bacterium]|nr:DUF3109 family protein [Muribaculaceae bacterium]
MFQIGENTIVSLDLAERFFCCDLDKCHGACCIEGDSGAPLTAEESDALREALPLIDNELIEESRERIRQADVSYTDEDGDLVTQIMPGCGHCVFVTRADYKDDICLCAVEKARRAGVAGVPEKPISCALYPLRLTEYADFTAVNYHRWDICRCAEEKGRKEGIRLYQFLEGPLVRRFGQEWYDELVVNCELWLSEQSSK